MTEVKVDDQTLKALAGKVIIITGGSSGIGLATVSLALELGAKVVMGDRNPPPPKVEHENMAFCTLDVTSWDALSGLFEKAVELHGRIDHVFANAGVAPRTTLLEETLDSNGKLLEPDYRVIDINLKSVMNTTALAIHYMKKQDSGGSIVLTASASSFQRFQAVDYTIAKHGVLGVMRALVPHLSPKLPIRINAIAPSWTDTGIVPADLVRATGALVMEPPAVARSALFLMAADARNAHLLYSQALADGGVEYREIDEGLLKAAAALTREPGPTLQSTLADVRAVSEKAVTG